VAIKVLPDEFAQDEQRLRRFRREPKVLASLNHPNIAAIYGLEQSGDVHYLVLELVPGETLAERIARGPIPVDEALEISAQIVEALQEAHEHGIVHRDLKPANIKLTEDGKVKVLDFGLAKVFADETAQPDGSMSPPTLTRLRQGSGGQARDATRVGVGVVLGTAAYMSPEQAKGKRVDKRADIWAFGAVLYEMLTGKRAFVGEDVSDTLAAVLRDVPKWDALPVDFSTTLRTVLASAATGRLPDRVLSSRRGSLFGRYQAVGVSRRAAIRPQSAFPRRLSAAASGDRVHRTERGDLSRRPVAGLPVRRLGPVRDLRAAVPERRGWTLADLERRWCAASVGSGRP